MGVSPWMAGICGLSSQLEAFQVSGGGAAERRVVWVPTTPHRVIFSEIENTNILADKQITIRAVHSRRRARCGTGTTETQLGRQQVHQRPNRSITISADLSAHGLSSKRLILAQPARCCIRGLITPLEAQELPWECRGAR